LKKNQHKEKESQI